MNFRKGQKGAVTVFLTLVLVPVMIFSFLATDAARIYSAKVVASDSGELAMNAALAQYDADLFDKYGLLAMENTPESMQGLLEQCFNDSLCSGSVSGYEDMLGLIEESFEALSVSNTEIYRTDVEKQQIIEYMKYRAPVCLTDLVIEKFKFIKDSEKIMDAVNKELDFAEAMEECQDAFEDAYNTLKSLDSIIETFPDQQDLQNTIAQIRQEFTWNAASAFLMRAALESYKDATDSQNNEQDMASFVNAVNKLDFNNPISEDSYESAKAAKHYKTSIELAGKTVDVEETDEYKAAVNKFNSYLDTLDSYARGYISNGTNELNSFYEDAGQGKKLSEDAAKKLEDVRKTLNQARTSYDRWDESVSKLDKEAAGSMKNEVEDYASFFRDNMDDLSKLQMNMDKNVTYFDEMQDIISQASMCEIKIATTPANEQSNKYSIYAKNAISSGRNQGGDIGAYDYLSLENYRVTAYVDTFVAPDISTTETLYHIHDDAFYLRLEEYCKKNESEKGQEEADNANKKLDEGGDAASSVKDDIELLQYNWSNYSPLPSVELGLAEFGYKASESYTDMGTGNDIQSSSSRKSIIKKMKQSISEASSFLKGLDSILADNLENLYVAEYAMQMFSHYNCDKTMKEDKSLAETDNMSLSGYALDKNPAYKGEIEYILWGNSNSAENVLSTFELLFGVRLLFNSIYAFTDKYVQNVAFAASSAIAVGAPYLQPVISTIIKLGFAVAETGIDVSMLKQGYGVAIMKTENKNNFVSCPPLVFANSDVRDGVTFDYGEYLRIFLNVKMMAGDEDKVLARIADCVQVNTSSNIIDEFTMVSVQSQVGVKTNFMRKISDWASSNWKYDGTYTIDYQSVLAY